MKVHESRAETRIPVREKAWLITGLENAEDARFQCVVQNVSDRGFQISCKNALSVGQILDFTWELFPGKTLNCMIEVRHIGPSGVGTMVTEIDNRGTALMQLYLQEQYALKIGGKY